MISVLLPDLQFIGHMQGNRAVHHTPRAQKADEPSSNRYFLMLTASFAFLRSLVTARAGTPPDGRLGVRDPRTEHLAVLYATWQHRKACRLQKPDRKYLPVSFMVVFLWCRFLVRSQTFCTEHACFCSKVCVPGQGFGIRLQRASSFPVILRPIANQGKQIAQ